MRRNSATCSALLALAAALVIAGCGSGSGPAAASDASDASRLLGFAHCMRAHRVPDFPDPGSASPSGSGVSFYGIALPPTFHVRSPAFQAAMSACQKLATAGAPQAGVTEAQKEAALRYSQCMGAHGVPNFPDPVFRNGRIGLDIGGVIDNPNSPALLAAEKACGNP